KSSLPWDHALNFGSIGVTGASSANAIAAEADLVIGVGTRFQDFTTGSWDLFRNPQRKILSINIQSYDAAKHGAVALVGDARSTLEELHQMLGSHAAPIPDASLRDDWLAAVDAVTA